MLLTDLIEPFLSAKQFSQGRSVRTVAIYRLALNRLAEFAPDRDPRDLSPDELATFAGPWLHKLGNQAVSRRTHVAAVREFYRWMVRTERMATSPAAALPYPAAGMKIPKVMTLANAQALMWAPDFTTFEGVRDSAMLSLLIGCGLRVSGLVNLNRSNLLEDEVDGRRRLFLRVTEKGDRQRNIPVPPEAELVLRMYLEHPQLKTIDATLEKGDEVLFVTVRNRACPAHEYRGARRRFGRSSVRQMIQTYARRAGVPIDQAHPHALRHLYGTELAEDDVDSAIRQRLLGHADPKSTQIYTHLARRKLTREVDRANPLAKIRTPISDLLKRLGK